MEQLDFYIVQRGDTLAGIALQRDMTLRELKVYGPANCATLNHGN